MGLQEELDINNVHRELGGKDLVVFAGSGASHVPAWNRLLKGLLESQPVGGLDLDNVNEYNYPECAQMFFNEFKREGNIDRYWALVEEQLRVRDEPYRTLQLNILYATTRVITTNLERSFEDAFETYLRRKRRQERYRVQILPHINTDALRDGLCITYLHGRIDMRNIVFTSSVYQEYYGGSEDDRLTELEQYLKDVYHEYTIVFVGFSFQDRFLSNALKRVHAALMLEKEEEDEFKPTHKIVRGRKRYGHYAFLKKEDPELDQRMDVDLKAIGINVIRYQEHKEVARCFERIELSRLSPIAENKDG